MTLPNYAKPSVGMNKVCGHRVATPLFWHRQQQPAALRRRLTLLAPYFRGVLLGVGLGACLIRNDVIEIGKIIENIDGSVLRALLMDMTAKC